MTASESNDSTPQDEETAISRSSTQNEQPDDSTFDSLFEDATPVDRDDPRYDDELMRPIDASDVDI